ncbi:T9SS type A sorting domain-containing protein [Taibaiella helva]|uniref:T9SS type A sorting domain-containing protein n=1 Tax=Taibaiella helva TaxID=2301235 RepID=UPI000E57282D|nr:T9SS type A sorting domain-containing protein [Taibaiella helva]
MRNKLFWLAVMLCLTALRSTATIVYVDSANFAGNQDGTSWASAYYSFQYGIDFANPGDTVWVAKGTYSPVAGTSFTLKKDLKIFGGFKNTDTVFSQRDFTTNITRLKGNSNSVIQNDSALLITTSMILDGFIIASGNGYVGGGIYNRYASPTITNCTFTNNTTSPYTSGGGGAMMNVGGAPYIAYCTFSGNSAPIFYGNPPNASGSGGGGAVTNSGSSPVFYRCTFNSNSAAGFGGAMYNVNAHPTISYCKFEYNTVSSPSIFVRGGAIYNDPRSTLDLDSCIFSRNNGVFYGGAIYNDSVSLFRVTRCVFSYNNGAYGAGIYSVYGLADTLNLCSFNNNTANNSGGGIYVTEGKVIITNATFSGNKSNATVYDGGGGMYLKNNSTVTVSNCNFSGNYSGARGGSVYLDGAATLRSTFSNCSFDADSADYGAGIMSIVNSPVSISNCTFNQGKGNQGPGAVMLAGNSSLPASYITGCSFTGNKSAWSGGGALQLSGLLVSVTNCTFASNSTRTNDATSKGGAIYITVYNDPGINPTIANCTFTNNTAYTGGGIYSEAQTADVSSCNFIGNTATYQGGGFGGATIRLRNCNFVGNNARYGGGIYPGGFPIEHCWFGANTARIGGGINSNSSLTSVVNCVFTQNTVDSFGGGMYNSAPPAFVTNSTFSGNKANVLGSPIYNTNFGDYNDSTFTNCVIWGNYSGIYNQNTGASAFSYSLVQGLGTFAAKHIIGGTINPQFVDTATGNFRLQATSPCVDQGYNSYVPATINTDFDNGARIQNSTVDFGAFEFGSIPLASNLLHFSGKKQGDGAVLLEWRTNNSEAMYTILQRSSDGRNFAPVYSVHTDAGLNSQSYLDEQPQQENYYRLVTSDEQGSLRYSNTVLVRFNTISASATLYPNPAKESIHIVMNAAGLLHSTAVITDLTGKVISRVSITATDQWVSLAGIPAGMYILRLADGSTFKFSKQ